MPELNQISLIESEWNGLANYYNSNSVSLLVWLSAIWFSLFDWMQAGCFGARKAWFNLQKQTNQIERSNKRDHSNAGLVQFDFDFLQFIQFKPANKLSRNWIWNEWNQKSNETGMELVITGWLCVRMSWN